MVSRFNVAEPTGDLPVTLDDAKAWLKLTEDDEDTLIEALISSAHRRIIDMAQVCPAETEITQGFDAFFSETLTLSVGPVTEVTEVEYTKSDGATATVTGYRLDNIGTPARLIAPLSGWPTDVADMAAVRVTYTCGYTDPLPQPIRTAMLCLIAFMYQNREDMPLSGATERTVSSLLADYKIRSV